MGMKRVKLNETLTDRTSSDIGIPALGMETNSVGRPVHKEPRIVHKIVINQAENIA